MIDICDFALGLSRQLYGLTMHSERPGHRMYEQWHPLGPVGIISAFNFPVAVWSWNSALAAVCGDTMIWKPSPQTPLVSIAVQHICNQVMADHGLNGIFTLAIGTNDVVGEAMIHDPRLPLVSFTGSVRTGRNVAQAVAGRLGRTILELGGNNAIIVTDDANLDLAVRAILFGAAGTAGQRCTSTRRIIAHASIVDDLTDRLRTRLCFRADWRPPRSRHAHGAVGRHTCAPEYAARAPCRAGPGRHVGLWGSAAPRPGPEFRRACAHPYAQPNATSL